jgi:hypothetical protein
MILAWERTLAHRPPEARGAFHARFLDHGILPDQVKAVLDDFSAVSVAAHLGVSRQKVYELSWPTRAAAPTSTRFLGGNHE